MRYWFSKCLHAFLPQEKEDRKAVRAGISLGLRTPGIGLGVSFVTLGVLMAAANLSSWQALFSTILIYAMPAQLVLVEQWQLSHSVLTVWLAVFFANLRLLPMAIVLRPELSAQKPWHYTLAGHFVAITSWLSFLGAAPDVPRAQRLYFYFSLSVTLWIISCICTVVGYHIAIHVNSEWLALLVLLNPVYLMAMMLRSLRTKADFFVVVVGSGGGVVLSMWFPVWGVLITGIVVGSLGWLLVRRKA